MNKCIQFKIKTIKSYLFLSLILLLCNSSYAGNMMNVTEIIQQKRITLSIQNKSAKIILTEIEKISGLSFIIKEDAQINTLDNLSIDVKDVTVETALKTLLSGTNFTYKIIDNIITIVRKAPEEDKKMTISGKVLNKEGKMPIVGATVIVQGTNNGAIADDKGNFSLTTNLGSMVEVSFVGYKSQTLRVDAQIMNILMEYNAMEVNDVYVTGYQQISKERSTGSYEIIKGSEVNRTLSQDIVSRIDGKIAGLQVDKDGKITIRGRGSILSNTEPLFVVDGFPVEGGLNTINPDDIESITVLKDAAAASIWGVRAANGVIVVTTKKGTQDGKISLDVSYTMSISSKANMDDLHLMSAKDNVNYILEKYERGLSNFGAMDYYHSKLDKVSEAYYEGILKYGKDVKYPTIAADAEFQSKIKALEAANFFEQFEKYLLQNAFNNRLNLSLRGGNEKYDYLLSGVYNSNMFQAVGDEDDDFLINFKNNIRLLDRLKLAVGVNIHYNNAAKNGIDIAQASREYPFHDLVNENEERIQYSMVDKWHDKKLTEMGYLPYSYNMMDEQQYNNKKSKEFSARLHTGLNLKIVEGLTIETQFQYERGMIKNEELLPVQHPTMRNWINMYTLIEEDGSLNQQLPQGAMYDVANHDFEAWTWRNQLNFNKSFNSDKHIVSAILGHEMRMYRTSMNQRIQYGYDPISMTSVPINDKGFYNDEIAPWAYGSQLRGPFTQYGETDNRDISLYINGSYSYKEKYSVTASGRIDQSNIFGNDSKYKYNMIWSTGVSWKISGENFLKNKEWLNLLMLRATIGIGGNVNKQFYPVLMGEYLTDDKTGVSYVSLTNPANKNLKWETSKTMNFGLDFAMFNNRLTGNVDYYNKKGIDLLGRATLDPTHGFANATMNFASMKNNGLEVTLNGDIFKTKQVRWNLGVNISYNNNEVTRVDDEGSSTNDFILPAPSGAGVAVVGKPIDRLYAYDYAGLNENGECMLWDEGEKVLHTDYVQNPDKLVYMGKSVAPWYGGAFTSVSYKGFTLSAQAIFKFGHKFKTPVSSTKSVLNPIDNVSKRWMKPGDENHTIVPTMHKNRNVQWSMDEYYQNASSLFKNAAYLKLSDVTLSYDFKNSVLKKSFVKGLTVDFQVRNACQWNANDENINPETVLTEPTYGFMSYALSVPRTFILSIKATF